MVVVGLLLCALTMLEIPELLSLCDNTSNDFSTAVFQGKGSTAASRNQAPDVPQAVVSIRAAVGFLRLVERPGTSTTWISSPELLHLLCVQRT